MYSAKEEKRRFDLNEERKALTEEEKDVHFIEHIKDVIWNYDSSERSRRLIKEGRLVYIHRPGDGGYIERA